MSTPHHDTAPAVQMRRAVTGSLIGSSLEWYDYFLYGAASALVFNKIFFPSFDPLTGTLLAFLTFSVGFIVRPIGAAVAGHFGDRIGRKKVMLVTIVAMGTSTVLIGLLPTYATIGVAAPLMLVLIRIVQGLALGGEWGGGALMIAERAPAHRRGFLTSFVQVGASIGNLLSTGMLFVLSSLLTQDAFLSWGWRIPFLFSAVVVLVGLYVRLKMSETPAFHKLEEHGKASSNPVRDVIREQPLDLLRVMGIRAGADIMYYVLITFLLTYIADELGLPRTVGLLAAMIGATMQLFTYPLFAAISDRFGRRRLTIIGAIGAIVWMPFLFPLVDTGSTVVIIFAVLAGLVWHSAMYGVQAAWICELFDAKHRYSGASLGYQLAGIVGGSLAPTIAIGLLSLSDSTVPVTIYVCIALAIVAITAMLTRETRGIDLNPSVDSVPDELNGSPAS
ncbi:MFS transporter [Rhodococcus sp. NPDC057297]|uniref:MFS transporter n=1 Tax=Rhodococcus sp. NPDC057297 TaxID=3346090 RepID=UPI0036314D85